MRKTSDKKETLVILPKKQRKKTSGVISPSFVLLLVERTQSSMGEVFLYLIINRCTALHMYMIRQGTCLAFRLNENKGSAFLPPPVRAITGGHS